MFSDASQSLYHGVCDCRSINRYLYMKHTRPSSVAVKYPEYIWHVWHMPWVEEIRFWGRGANQAPRFRLGSKLYGLTQTGERHWILKLFELRASSWYLMKSCHMMTHYNHLTAGGDQRISLFQQRGLTGHHHHHQTSLSIWTVWSITGHLSWDITLQVYLSSQTSGVNCWGRAHACLHLRSKHIYYFGLFQH